MLNTCAPGARRIGLYSDGTHWCIWVKTKTKKELFLVTVVNNHYFSCLISVQTLFIAIPMFLDSNPFSDDEVDEEEGKTKGMDSVLSVFQMTFDLLLDLDIHPQITSQLFAYLLFFTNASLFNMLVERG